MIPERELQMVRVVPGQSAVVVMEGTGHQPRSIYITSAVWGPGGFIHLCGVNHELFSLRFFSPYFPSHLLIATGHRPPQTLQAQPVNGEEDPVMDKHEVS